MQAQDLIQRVAEYDKELARDLSKFVGSRRLGLVYEESKPEYVRLTNKPVVVGDLVNILPPRGTLENLMNDSDEHDVIWRVVNIVEQVASLSLPGTTNTCNAALSDLVPIARFDQPIFCGLTETGRVEHGSEDSPYHVVINGENYHALESLLFCYRHSIDCIYIDPPYNSGARDWKYNNNYVGKDDAYRHSKWLTYMEDRLRLAKVLLNPEKSALMIAIDEKEVHRLGLLVEQLFPEADIQMVTTIVNAKGAVRVGQFSRVEEHLFIVSFGSAIVQPLQYNMLDSTSDDIRNEPKPVEWLGLRRRENTSVRAARPNQFYPIFVNDETGFIHSIGDAITPDVKKESVPAPEGTTALWPLKPDGTEMLWGLTPDVLRRNVKLGYVRINNWNKKKHKGTVQYLQGGVIADIDKGAVSITGHREDGSIIAEYKIGSEKISPKRVWNMPSHNSENYGTNLLTSLLGKRKFPFPKSLYAVEDVLRFYVADNPNAIVLDFFSGSGTTAHAVMRLNHYDGGHRTSISVTNNEVSEEEAKRLTNLQLRQGDEEWEALGICEYITKPRIAAAITGHDVDGNPIPNSYKFIDPFPMSDGFDENALFFDLTYLEPSVISADLAFNEIAPLLWMRSGSRGPIILHSDTYEITDSYAVLFDYSYVAAFTRECKERDVNHIFVVTDIDANYRHMCAEFKGKDVAQLYKSYLHSFEIGVDR